MRRLENLKKTALEVIRKYPKFFNLVLPIGLVYIIGQLIFQSSSRFFTGDHALISAISYDLAHGKFYSWYFYGQDYLGNLVPAVYAIIGRITGFSFGKMAAIENLFYCLALLFVMLASGLKKFWHVFIVTFILIANPYFSEYIFKPQSFAFVAFIFSIFFFLYSRVYRDKTEKKELNVTILLTGLFASLSIWHNVFYIIILPILIIILVIKRFRNRFELQRVLYFLPGLLIGIIPFIAGYKEKMGRNLEWYFQSSSGESVSIFNSLYYYFSEMIMYFSTKPIHITYSTFAEFISQYWFNPVRLSGLVSGLTLVVFLIFGLKYYKKYLVNYLFIFFMALLLIARGADYTLNAPFSLARYSLVFHVFWIVTAFAIFREFIATSNSKMIRVLICSLMAFTSFFALIFSASALSATYYDKPDGLFSYQQAYEDITEKYDVSNVFCENYFEMCGQLTFLGKMNNNLTVQVIDGVAEADSPSKTRNPEGFYQVDKALERGERVLTVVPQDMYDGDNEILETYLFRGVREYYLIEGKY